MIPHRLMLAALMAGLTASAAHAEDVSTVVEQVNTHWMQAAKSQDAAAIAALYTPDAIVQPAGAAAVTGRDNVQKLFQGFIQAGWSDVALKSTQSKGEGDIAWDAGHWTAMTSGRSGQKVPMAGDYLVVLQRQGGDWLIRADTWNMAAPQEAPAASGSTTR